MAEPSSSNAPRQLMQLGATFLVAACVGWALGASFLVIAASIAIALSLGVAGAVLRRGKSRS